MPGGALKGAFAYQDDALKAPFRALHDELDELLKATFSSRDLLKATFSRQQLLKATFSSREG